MLDEARKKLLDSLGDGSNASTIRQAFDLWFQALKSWESQDEFQRALDEGRMTGRTFNPMGKASTIPVGPFGKKVNITLDTSLMGLKNRLTPDNFLAKKKNELGLHDVSAVLLKPGVSISKQLFGTGGAKAIVFMPLPQEEDLVAFSKVAARAKSHVGDLVHGGYQTARASFTRIKYGAYEDMTSGFGMVDKSDGKKHVRYGMHNIMGGALNSSLLAQRNANAMAYKTKVLGSNKVTENNEVVVSYRQHGGKFPVVGAWNGNSSLFELYTVDQKPCGTLTDDGVFKPA